DRALVSGTRCGGSSPPGSAVFLVGRLRGRLRLAEPVAVRVSWVVGGRAPNRRRSPDCCRSVSWVGRLRGRLRLAEPVCRASLGLLGAVPRTGAGRPTAAALFLGS